MATNPRRMRMSVEEYLAFDRASEIKHEYHEGEVVAMSGGTGEHSRLAGMMYALLFQELGDNSPCIVYTSDMRVEVAKDKYVYPDATVSCDISDHVLGNDILHSPHVVVEVLSPSTERTDRNQKMKWYKALPTVQEYLLVNYRVRLVEVYRRITGDTWQKEVYGPGQLIDLSLDIQVDVDRLYGRLAIPAP